MPLLHGQSSKENVQATMREEYVHEYDQYRDFLVNDHVSNHRRPYELSQLVRDLDKVLGDAGHAEPKTKGNSWCCHST